jgi:hypothetical protein
MQQSTAVALAWTVGLDVGDRVSHVCVLDAAGRIVERARVATTVEAMTRWAARPAARVVLEAGTHSLAVGDLRSNTQGQTTGLPVSS